MPKKTKAKTARSRSSKRPSAPKTVTKDGLFISRKMRRDAEAAAKDEADRLRIETEDYQDAQDRAAYDADPKNANKSDAEKAYESEKAQAQANADARKKHGLK